MLRQPNNQIYKTVVIVWLTLSVASVLLSTVTWVELSRKLAEARAAVEIRTELDAVFKLLLDSETAQRGFALTGDERFLEPLRAAELELPVRFDRLAETTRNDSAMLKRVIDLQAQAEVVLNYLQRVIKVRRER